MRKSGYKIPAIYSTGNLIFPLPVVDDSSNIKIVLSENFIKKIVKFLLSYTIL